MSDLKLSHEFHKKNGSWQICDYYNSTHTNDDEIDCTLCTLGYALGVAIRFTQKFQDFCKTSFIEDSDTYIWLLYDKHIIRDGTMKPNTTISFTRDYGDYEIWFTKENSSFEIQQIYADYMNYRQGTPCIIEKVHFDELLKKVIALTKNNTHEFTLVEENNGSYSIIK